MRERSATSTHSLHVEELRVQSFFIEQPTGFTDADKAAVTKPITGTDEPTMSGCSCVETCPGGAC
jgi:hypothetical protein